MHLHLKQQLSWRWRQTAKNPPCFGFACLTGGTDRRYFIAQWRRPSDPEFRAVSERLPNVFRKTNILVETTV
jgi:hypothetical protein